MDAPELGVKLGLGVRLWGEFRVRNCVRSRRGVSGRVGAEIWMRLWVFKGTRPTPLSRVQDIHLE